MSSATQTMTQTQTQNPERPPPDLRRAADVFRLAADPTRLQVLAILGAGERNVTELAADLGIGSQPAVSHHLCIMKLGRLIEPRREGKCNYYRITDRGRKLFALVGPLTADD